MKDSVISTSTPCLRKCTCCLRIPGRAIGVEVSHDDVVITKVKKKVKVRYEIGGTSGYRGDVFNMNVDGDIVDGGCNGEVIRISDGVGGNVDKSDEVMNEDDKSSTTRINRTVLTERSVAW